MNSRNIRKEKQLEPRIVFPSQKKQKQRSTLRIDEPEKYKKRQ